MTEEADVNWKFYKENVDQGRHVESQRAATTNLVVFICAALLGLISFDEKLSPTDLPMTVFVAFLGVFGALFVAKQYERFTFHKVRARQFRARLSELIPDAGIMDTTVLAYKQYKASYPVLSRLGSLRMAWFWVGIHLVVAAIGVVLSAVAMA